MLPQWEPKSEPPRWLASAMSVFPARKGETFEEYWRRTEKDTDARAATDEKPVKG
jgi:hypothetical protein